MKDKNFQDWHILKKKINGSDDSHIFFHEKQIWYLSCGLNIGSEQDGKGEFYKRPVLILKKFNSHTFLGIPLISVEKKGRFYFSFSFQEGKKSYAILSQVKFFDRKRLLKKIGGIGKQKFLELKYSLGELFEIPKNFPLPESKDNH